MAKRMVRAMPKHPGGRKASRPEPSKNGQRKRLPGKTKPKQRKGRPDLPDFGQLAVTKAAAVRAVRRGLEKFFDEHGVQKALVDDQKKWQLARQLRLVCCCNVVWPKGEYIPRWRIRAREKHLAPYLAAGGPEKPPAGTVDFWVLRDVEDVLADDMRLAPRQANVKFKE